MKRTERSALGWYTIGIAALFLAGFFLLVLFGSLTYRNTVRSQSGNYDERSLTAYLTTAVRANDSAGSVRVESSEYGPMLVLADGDSGFSFRIWRYDGHLVEEYGESDAAPDPEAAQVIGDTDEFSVDWLTDELLSVRTDAGRALIAVRCDRQGGAGQ